jgi:hypothetical protein
LGGDVPVGKCLGPGQIVARAGVTDQFEGLRQAVLEPASAVPADQRVDQQWQLV